MNLIETHQLSCRFWRTEAVRELSFAVPEGGLTALVGANGAGKTTTLKLVMNLLAPSAGTSRVLGVDSRRLGERERAQIGYISEGQELPEWMTVRQLLDFCRPLYRAWDRALEARLLAQFDLPVERRLQQLSRGMRMKVALLSSLAYRPRLLVLDEPFSGLDPLVREELVQGILEVAGQGDWTVLISSHDIDEVERLADRIVLLEAGRLRCSETTEALFARFRRIEVTVPEGAADGGAAPPDWLELERQGRRVRFVAEGYERGATERACRERWPEAAVTAQRMTLREIFVALARAGRRNGKGART